MKIKKRLFLKTTLITLFLTFGRDTFARDGTNPDTSSDLPSQSNSSDSENANSTLTVHKPAPNPAWGKVVQYQQEQALSNTDKTRETLHKFLFQDSKDIIRLATFHESASGNGYWEVWVWDQP